MYICVNIPEEIKELSSFPCAFLFATHIFFRELLKCAPSIYARERNGRGNGGNVHSWIVERCAY